MSEILFYKIINNEIDLNQFLEWLLNDQTNSPICNEINCNQGDFLTYFLNFIHQDIPNYCTRWGTNLTKIDYSQPNLSESLNRSLDINKSPSFPLDLSNNLDTSGEENVKTSTPKMLKIQSDSSIGDSFTSPISPLYQSKARRSYPEKSPICLGDFIVNKRFSSTSIKKKSRINTSTDNGKQRRIKPTNLTEKLNNCERYENSFDFVENNSNCTINQQKTTTIKLNSSNIEIRPKLKFVNYQKQLDRIVRIYIELINNSFVYNIINEINFLIMLLLKKQYKIDDNCDNDSIISDLQDLFKTVHNLVYFVTRIIQTQYEIFTYFDRNTLKLLIDNQRLSDYVPEFVQKLRKLYNLKCDDTIYNVVQSELTVCFNIDTDNRTNFPNDLSFHSFRKQRDLFYEILHIWELQHLNNDWNFYMSLSGKIKTLLNLCNNESMNFIHFARLFKLQLLNYCNNCGNQQQSEVVANLPIDIDKFHRLKTRLTMNDTMVVSSTMFLGREEFFKDFILTANHCYFNRHLCDSLICEIIELNETNFNFTDLGDIKEIQLDLSTKKSFFTCIKSLRLLAKFLGFIESLPYQSDVNNLTQNLMTQHLKVRGQIQPNFDIKTILEESIRRKTLIICIPWLTIYLSMLDYIKLRLPYYIIIGKILYEIYRNFNKFLYKKNQYFIRFCLGNLFETKQYPIDEYYNHLFYEKRLTTIPTTIQQQQQQYNINNDEDTITVDNLDIIDQNLLYLCVPNLLNIKKLLINDNNNNSNNNNNNQEHNVGVIKHVTPVTTLHTVDELNRKRLEQQLEEAFLNGQPISIRKTIEFISERIASICVKYIINIIIPKYKQSNNQLFYKFLIDNNLLRINLKNKQQLLFIENYKLNILKQLQQLCYDDIIELCTEKIKQSIDALISLDVLQQTKDVCCNITKRTCLERIKQWIASHITTAIFTKDFDEIIFKIKHTSNNHTDDNNSGDDSVENRRRQKPLFVLPPEGNNVEHNEDTISAAHLLEKLTDLSVAIIENHEHIDDDCVTKLLDDCWKSIKQRGDINECILSTICTTLVDVALLLLAHKSELLVNGLILDKMHDIWQLYYLGTNELFKSLLCQRNIILFAQSKQYELTWLNFAKFTLFLIQKKLLNFDNFETQCTGIFRTEWDQHTLKLITNFLKEFVQLYRNDGGSTDDFTFLLDFLSDYCEDLL